MGAQTLAHRGPVDYFVRCRLIFSSYYSSSYPLHTKMFISSHITSRKRQVTLTFTGRSRTTGFFQYGACFTVPFWHLDPGDGSYIFGKFVAPCVTIT